MAVSKNVRWTSSLLLILGLQPTQGSNGIQTLLEAEKDAAKIVQEARGCKSHNPGAAVSVRTTNLMLLDRTQKLKEARSQAEKEIAKYKAQKEEEFKSYEAEVRPNSSRRWVSPF